MSKSVSWNKKQEAKTCEKERRAIDGEYVRDGIQHPRQHRAGVGTKLGASGALL
jgi:hypothetical protein